MVEHEIYSQYLLLFCGVSECSAYSGFSNQCLWSLVFVVAWEGEQLQQAFGGA